jgi:hypothetical protein
MEPFCKNSSFLQQMLSTFYCASGMIMSALALLCGILPSEDAIVSNEREYLRERPYILKRIRLASK